MKLIFNKSELVGSCYFEIMPRKYDGKPWNEDSVYLTEDSYLIIEPAFKEVLTNYDYFSFMTFGLEELNKICSKLGEIISLVSSAADYPDWLNHLRSFDNQSFEATKLEIITLVSGTKNWLESAKQNSSEFSLLGM